MRIGIVEAVTERTPERRDGRPTDTDDRYPGLPPEIQAALKAAAADGRDSWIDIRLGLVGQEVESPGVLDERVGGTVFVRHADPCDPPDPPRILIRPGDRVILTTPVGFAGLNSTSEVGRVDDLIASARVVLDRREDGVAYGRTLRDGEPDDGRRIHVRPGEQLVFETGALQMSLDDIDRREPATETGYVNLAPVIWAWLQLSPPTAESVRYVLAAARRLDAANRLLLSVQQASERLSTDADAGDVPGPTLRRHFADMLSSVEMLVVALGRVTDMVCSARSAIGSAVPVPRSVNAKKDAIRTLRNACEHIEDRALGHVNGKPDPQALTIFDYEPLLAEDAMVYGKHRLGVTDEIPGLLADMRQFIKDVVSGRGGAAADRA
ncbi:MAG: light-mediated development protein [Streptosporangiaceae bacterium]|nr:light-mediated development protein [Streptosporangiaceae bacterium]